MFEHRKVEEINDSYNLEAIRFLHQKYIEGKGAYVVDDDSRDTWIQLAGFLIHGISQKTIHAALLIVDCHILPQFENFLKNFLTSKCLVELYNGSSAQKLHTLRNILSQGGILLATYSTFAYKNNYRHLGGHFLKPPLKKIPIWDCMVAIDGHRIIGKVENTSKSYKCLTTFSAKCRFIVSGSSANEPLRSIDSIWQIHDFVQFGTLLGSHQNFRANFGDEIMAVVAEDVTKLSRNATYQRLARTIEPVTLVRRRGFKKKSRSVRGTSIPNFIDVSPQATPVSPTIMFSVQIMFEAKSSTPRLKHHAKVSSPPGRISDPTTAKRTCKTTPVNLGPVTRSTFSCILQ